MKGVGWKTVKTVINGDKRLKWWKTIKNGENSEYGKKQYGSFVTEQQYGMLAMVVLDLKKKCDTLTDWPTPSFIYIDNN